MSNNPVSDKWAKRIRAMWDWQQGFRGDNVRQAGNSVYVGSGVGGRYSGHGPNWHPRQFLVKTEENDYLTCVPYNSATETAGETEYKVAKPVGMRGGDQRWGVSPPYVPDASVIWAAPLRNNGVEDDDENAVTLVDLNLEGRSADGFWAKLTTNNSTDTTLPYRWAWTEQELVAGAFADKADGRSGTVADDGGYAVQSDDGFETGPPPAGTVVWLRPSQVTVAGEGQDPVTVYAFDTAAIETGFGKPVSGASDLPIAATIELTITTAAGVPILDSGGSEQTITVWRNAMRKSLYLDFISTDVFMYVKFAPNYTGVEGCIYSRTEGMITDSGSVPSGGLQLNGSEAAPLATDATGSYANADHLYVTGHFYYEKSGGTHGNWVPWFAIDPDELPATDGKVFTDGDDTTKGFLDDEIIVDPGGGAEFWLSKAVDPGGVNDNKLLLEHKNPQASVVSLTPMTSLTEPADGTVRINSASVPVDNKGHVVTGDSVSNTHDIIFDSSDSSVSISTSIAAGDVTVDITGASGGDADSVNGIEFVDVLIKLDNGDTVPQTKVVDSDDYSGRSLYSEVATAGGATAAFWADNTQVSNEVNFVKIGTAETVDVEFVSAGGLRLYIDVSDGYKLKVDATTAPTSGTSDYIQLMIAKGSRKTAADVTFS